MGAVSRSIPASANGSDGGSSRPPPSRAPIEPPSAQLAASAAARLPPASGADERAAALDKAARALLPLLPARGLPVAGGAGSRVPYEASRYEKDAIALLIDKGGKVAQPLIDARLFLESFAAWQAEAVAAAGGACPPSIFPIDSSDARSAREAFVGVSAKDRVPMSMRLLASLKLATYDASVFERRVTTVCQEEGSAPADRGVPPPIFVTRLAAKACGPVDMSAPDAPSEGRIMKHREAYAELLVGGRPGGFHDSRVANDPKENGDCMHLCINEDKIGRRDVHQYAPMIDVRDGSLVPWRHEFIDERRGLQCVVSDFASPAKSGSSITRSTYVLRDASGRIKYCAKKRATDALTAVMPECFGVPEAELKAANLSGMYPLRKVGRHLLSPGG